MKQARTFAALFSAAFALTFFGGAGLYYGLGFGSSAEGAAGVDVPRARDGRGRWGREGRSSGASYAFFEFAPASGAGMGAACACAAVTGAKGETMTFTRATAGTCLKGNTTSGIVAGDMVTCSANQPRVGPGGTGTGALGVLVEGPRTNLEVRSQEFENAGWTKEAGITVSANDALCPLAPDNTQTMDLVTFGGASGTGIFQNGPITLNNTFTNSVFLARKTGGAACTLAVKDGATGAGFTNVVVAATISRPEYPGTAVGSTAGLYIRETTAGDCVDVCVWGGQTEQGATFASSYIATVGAAVARGAELAKFTITGWPATGKWSDAVTWVTPAAWPADPFVLEPSFDTVNRYSMWVNSPTSWVEYSVSTAAFQTVGPAISMGATLRLAAAYDGTTQYACLNGTCLSNAQAYTQFAITTLTVGSYQVGGDEAFGFLKLVCLDPTRCR